MGAFALIPQPKGPHPAPQSCARTASKAPFKESLSQQAKGDEVGFHNPEQGLELASTDRYPPRTIINQLNSHEAADASTLPGLRCAARPPPANTLLGGKKGEIPLPSTGGGWQGRKSPPKVADGYFVPFQRLWIVWRRGDYSLSGNLKQSQTGSLQS